MAEISGFHNSVDGDRKYNADDVNEFFTGVVAEGVFSTEGDNLIVVENTGMQIAVGSGKAWFLKSWYTNTADKFMVLSDSDLTYDRIDIIAIDFDKTNAVRTNKLIILEGTPASSPVPPTLIDVEDHLQVPLAHILVQATVTNIYTADITNKVGTTDCPFATGLIDQIDITTLLNQWDAEFDAWKQGIEEDLSAIETGTIFDEIEAVRHTRVNRNLLINGDMLINQNLDNQTVTLYDESSVKYPGVADRWGLDIVGTSSWTLSRGDIGDGRKSYRVYCSGVETGPPYPANMKLQFIQEIEASRLAGLYKGRSNAKEMTLGFDLKSNDIGDFIIEIYDRQNDWSISKAATYNVAGVWQPFEISIPAELTQPLTLDHSGGLALIVWFGAGTDYTAGGSLQTTWGAVTTNKRAYNCVNLARSPGGLYWFEIADVQLEIGNLKTEYERLPEHEVLRQCRRYMEWHDYYNWFGFATFTDTLRNMSPGTFHVRKRTHPSWSYDNAACLSPSVTLTNLTASPETRDTQFFTTFSMDADSGTPFTVGQIYHAYLNDVKIDAEIY